jgi:hypothetical protein
MTELRQRDPRHVDERHLKFIRALECCLPFCKREAEAAHLRMSNLAIGKRETGRGERPSDSYVVPLCPYHHRIGVDCQHNNNEKEWWERTGLNPWAIAASLWIESGGAARALEPRPAKRPRKTSRKRRHETMLEQGMHRGNTDAKFDPPPQPKRKIQSRPDFPQGRKLQSRGFERRT